MRHYFSIFLFSSVCVAVAIISLTSDTTDSDKLGMGEFAERDQLSVSYFKNLNYFVTRDKRDVLKVKTRELTQKSSRSLKYITFFDPVGTAYSKNNEPINFDSKDGHYYFKENTLKLSKDVHIKTTDSNMSADDMVYFFNEDKILGTGNVKTKTVAKSTLDIIDVSSKELESYPNQKISFFRHDVRGKIERKKKYEPPIYFSSEELKMDMPLNKIDLDREVHIRKGNLRTYAKRGEMFIENYNKRLKYFSLYDDVKVEETLLVDGRTVTRKAFGEKLEGFTSLEQIVLTGFPKVIQEGDLIKGNKITLRINNEVVEVDDANTRFELK